MGCAFDIFQTKLGLPDMSAMPMMAAAPAGGAAAPGAAAGGGTCVFAVAVGECVCSMLALLLLLCATKRG